MSLEDEAERQGAMGGPAGRTQLDFGSGWNFLFRFFALSILAAFATLAAWVPFQYLFPVGPAIVVGLGFIGLAALGGRIHELRQRIRALEAEVKRIADDATRPKPPQPPSE